MTSKPNGSTGSSSVYTAQWIDIAFKSEQISNSPQNLTITGNQDGELYFSCLVACFEFTISESNNHSAVR